jgi:glycosyltransferase involved in cell wall biosynthesis
MKILVLSFYFTPDLSAGSFRVKSIVKELKTIAPDAEIHVVTTLPNRYQSFSVDAPMMERAEGIFIRRIELPPHQSGMLDQSKAFLSFAIASCRIVRCEKYDIVFATSSRLMTAALGAWIAFRKKTKLYLDIRDIFVDTIKEVLRPSLAFILSPIFTMLEGWTIRRANKVNLVSGGFRAYFETRYPGYSFSYFTNGIDEEFIRVVPVRDHEFEKDRPLLVVYAGNLGEGQGMHLILPELAKRTNKKLHFRLFGDGGRKNQLLQALKMLRISNVEIRSPVSRDCLIEEYSKADLLFLHLNTHEAFTKVLPSKIFEYGAMGKPVWAGVPGFSADFIKSEINNSAVFTPCNVDAAINALSELSISTRPRLDFIQKYSRKAICRSMATDILVTANEG